LIELHGIRDAMPTDPYAETRFRAAKQADEDMRCDEPWLWHFANVLTWIIHPSVSLRLWSLERPMRRTERRTNYRGF
jgi:hypothetical protein